MVNGFQRRVKKNDRNTGIFICMVFERNGWGDGKMKKKTQDEQIEWAKKFSKNMWNRIKQAGRSFEDFCGEGREKD